MNGLKNIVRGLPNQHIVLEQGKMHLQRSSLLSCALCACACSGVSCVYVFYLLWLLLLIVLSEPLCLIRLLACRWLLLRKSGKASIMVA